jgi:hypothetical protein
MEFTTFRNFDNIDSLNEITEILKLGGFKYKIENTSTNFDPAMVNSIQPSYSLKLINSDFDLASKMIEESAKDKISQIPTDYYLYSFTDEELKEVLSKPDEWGRFDYSLAKEILSKKGFHLSESELDIKRKERINELAKPDDPKFYWILIGYGFAILGGIIGILWGWFLVTHKKTLPNGVKIQGYSNKYQKHGLAILTIGIGVMIVSILRKFEII